MHFYCQKHIALHVMLNVKFKILNFLKRLKQQKCHRVFIALIKNKHKVICIIINSMRFKIIRQKIVHNPT